MPHTWIAGSASLLRPNQLAFLREFDHVIGGTFITEKTVRGFLGNLAVNKELAGPTPQVFWADAHVLSIQTAGASQREMVRQMSEVLKDGFSLDIAKCGAKGGDFIYLDDVLFTGSRVGSDLEDWIANKAPKKARVHVIVMSFHMLGQYYTNKRLKDAITKSGKDIEVKWWRGVECENRKSYKDNSDVLWPIAIPADAAVQAYVRP